MLEEILEAEEDSHEFLQNVVNKARSGISSGKSVWGTSGWFNELVLNFMQRKFLDLLARLNWIRWEDLGMPPVT